MTTNLSLDDRLIDDAVRVGNHRSKKEAVTAALKEYVQAHKRSEILEWVGKIDYYDDYGPQSAPRQPPLPSVTVLVDIPLYGRSPSCGTPTSFPHWREASSSIERSSSSPDGPLWPAQSAKRFCQASAAPRSSRPFGKS